MKTKLILIIALLVTFMSFGQKRLADKFYKNFAYIKASELYEEAYNDGDDSEHVLTRLGNCYYNNSNSEKAAQWYKLALDKYQDKVSSDLIFKYIQTQRSLGNYEQANKWLAVLKQRIAEGEETEIDIPSLDAFEELSSTEGVYIEIQNLDINTQYSDFGSYIDDRRFYFASSRDAGGRIYRWNEQPYLDIFQSMVGEEDGKLTLSEPEEIHSDEINTPFHEGTLVVSPDGLTMYFTRDDLKNDRRLAYDNKGTSHLQLYSATKVNGSWENVVELPKPINDKSFSTGHPAISPDGKKLYFVSDREGGFGETDIYEVDILGNNTFSEPRNLGEKINTEGREMFPFIATDSTFYFSSDGFLNLGLLDIFKSNILKDENAEPVNLGAPFNTGFDDFAYYTDPITGYGFFSSNRPDGKGNDDIYSFATFRCKQLVSGVVRNAETGEPLEGAKVQKIDRDGKIIEEFITSAQGEYRFELDCDDTYTILAMKQDFKNDLKPLVTTLENDFEHKVDLNLIPLIKDDQIVINPIFFDFDRWNIRTDAKYELENIVDVMRQHPTMVIKIESHTDSRGSDRYNEKLSDRRAKSTRGYLISRGIAKERIESAIGYGEKQLLNECEDGVQCSEEKHQLNRRSYFYIVKQ